MKQKCIKENEILLIKGDKSYRLTFELQNENESMVIKAEEEKNEKVLVPCIYKKVITVNEWAEKERDIEIKIKTMEVVLKRIISSSKNNKLEFEIEDKKYIKLYYYFIEGEREEIYLPAVYETEDPQTIYTLSSLLSLNTKLLNRIFKYIKGLKININHANAFNIKLKNKENFHKNLFEKQTHEIKNIINDLKNYIQTFNEKQNEKISSNNKSFEDNFNQIKAEQTAISKKLNDKVISIQDNLNNQISSLKSELTHQITPQIITKADSIQNTLKQQIEENTKQFSDLNSKLTTQANSIQQQNENNDTRIKELLNKVSSVKDIILRKSKMLIFYKSLDGNEFSLYVRPNDTILELKKKILDKEGFQKIKPSDLSIIFGGKCLINNRTLSEYNIEEESTLHLALRLKG